MDMCGFEQNANGIFAQMVVFQAKTSFSFEINFPM